MLYLNLVYPVAFVVGNLVGWPLVGLVVGLVSGRGLSLAARPGAYARLPAGQLVLGGLLRLKLVVQTAAVPRRGLVGLAIAKVLTAWPLFIVCVS